MIKKISKKKIFNCDIIQSKWSKKQWRIRCANCRKAPEIDIDPNSKNNVVNRTSASGIGLNLLNIIDQSLKNVVKSDKAINRQMINIGDFSSLFSFLEHCKNITLNPQNNNFNPRLMSNGFD